MTISQETQEDPLQIQVLIPNKPHNEPTDAGPAPSEGGSDAPRKHKRRSGNSVDLTYRYHEPSDDELSWTEDEHGTRRRRKSRKRKSGGGDDFKTGIMYFTTSGLSLTNRPVEGKKRQRRRRSGQSAQGDDDGDFDSVGDTESESDSGDDASGKRW
jgi:hypothetical protein